MNPTESVTPGDWQRESIIIVCERITRLRRELTNAESELALLLAKDRPLLAPRIGWGHSGACNPDCTCDVALSLTSAVSYGTDKGQSLK